MGFYLSLGAGHGSARDSGLPGFRGRALESLLFCREA